MSDLDILIADDHELIRRGVRSLISHQTEWKVIAEARNGEDALRQAQLLQPDVAILDFCMPVLSGPAAAVKMRELSPRTAVIVLTMHDSEEVVREVLSAGALGYVLKTDADQDLVAAIEAVSQNRHFFAPRVAGILLEGFLVETKPTPHVEGRSQLTAREHEVLSLLANGMTSKQVATHLRISVRTAESHRMQVNRKLGFGSVTDLVRYAIKQGVVPPS